MVFLRVKAGKRKTRLKGETALLLDTKKKVKKNSKNVTPKKGSRTLIKLTQERQTTKAKLQITDNTKKISETALTHRAQLQVSILSPFRFPVPQEYFVGTVARYAGIFMIVVGGFFSLLNLQLATGTYALPHFLEQFASAVLTTKVTVVIPTTEENASVNIQPDARISVENINDVHGIVPVTITVPIATRVSLFARRVSDTYLIALGSATVIDATTWKFDWNTAVLDDDEYTLTAIIGNRYGSYNYSDSSKYVLRNLVTEISADVEEELVASTLTQIDASSTSSNLSITQQDNAQDETNNDSTENSSEDARSSLLQVNITPELVPDIDILLQEKSLVSNFMDVDIVVLNALSVEVYAIPVDSLIPQFLGLAKNISEMNWKYTWNTTQSPNGDYRIFARVKTPFGFVESIEKHASVQNSFTTIHTDLQKARLNLIQETIASLMHSSTEETASTTPEIVSLIEPKIIYIQSPQSFINSLSVPEDFQEIANELLSEFQLKLEQALDEFTFAKRFDDTVKVRNIENQINEIRNETIQKLRLEINDSEPIDSIDAYLANTASRLQDMIANNERIISEHLGDTISLDSDKDGITDYNEVALYQTNPFSADSDNDGFNDSTEITLGFNPKESARESLIAYESPKEQGLESEILSVDSITPIMSQKDEQQSIQDAHIAVISGKGLPNSFVTVNVFSTPVVSTVRTDAEGNWDYVFTSELETGTHEVYASMGDNSGKIVIKSEPLLFLKTPDGFTLTNTKPISPYTTESELASQDTNTLLLPTSIAIVALGLVLILLGIHVHDRRYSHNQVVHA